MATPYDIHLPNELTSVITLTDTANKEKGGRAPDFIHLHCHTAYSLLDSSIRLDDLVNKALELKMPAVAMTDHGNMSGVIEFYFEAKKVGIKPILGCEVYVAPEDHRATHRHNGPPAYHLVLLAQNLTGYHNLIKLVSRAYLEGFCYYPRIDLSLLKEYSEGLIALSACLQGRVPSLLRHNQTDEAYEATQTMAGIMGAHNFYLELQRTDLPEQKNVNSLLQEFAEKLGLELVATNDCHFLNRHDSEAHDVLICIQTGKKIADQNRITYSPELYFKSQEEMAKIFCDIPDALSNAAEIAQRCSVELPLGKRHFPRFPLPQGQSAEDALQTAAREGLQQRFQELKQRKVEFKEDVYLKRMEYELEILIQPGFADYFLIVADYVNWAKDSHIPVGPGSYTVAGSLVAWAMRITNLDPVRYGLLFERFINSERVILPDIPVEFCYKQHSKVLRYVIQTYDRENVARIANFHPMRAKNAIYNVSHVLGVPYSKVEQIIKLMSTPKSAFFEPGVALKHTLELEPRLRKLQHRKLKVANVLKIAADLEGLPRNQSISINAMVISDEPLMESLPLYRGPQGKVASQFDMKSVKKVGIIKFDFLSLRVLTLIDAIVNMVHMNHDNDFSIDDISMDDEETLALLSRGDSAHVFKLGVSGVKKLLPQIKPTCFEDIIALLALYRPGPLENGMMDDFIGRKHGYKKFKYLLPQLSFVLKETYGVILYHEQILEIAQSVAGYSLAEGNILRKAMGRKDPGELTDQRKRFLKGAAQNNIPAAIAQQIFDLLERFACPAVSKSYFVAHALLAYQNAYLKAHYPYEFGAALPMVK